MTDQPTTPTHTDRVLTLCADSGIEALDYYEAPNGVVRVSIMPLLMPFADVRRTLMRRMLEHGCVYGVSFADAIGEHASELRFEPMEKVS